MWGGGGVREWVKKKKLAGFEDLEIGGISAMYRGVFSPVYTFYIILHSVWGVNYTYIYQKRYFLSQSPNHVAM